MIEARVICDSVGQRSPRLTTFWTRYPKFVHAEHMRHRTGSYCVSSSRAIPVSKNLEEVRSDELRAAPVWWGREQKGMASGEELDNIQAKFYPLDNVHHTDRHRAALFWRNAALKAADEAAMLQRLGAHKSIVNRLLEPFLHVNVLVTSCEPGLLNFFGLRLDRAAQPEIRALAEAMWKAWNESTPTKLVPGQWHLPFTDDEENAVFAKTIAKEYFEAHSVPPSIMISTARCARLSYTSFETGRRSTIEEDLALYERLVGAHPIHASPAEHQATPDKWYDRQQTLSIAGLGSGAIPAHWGHPELHGNLPGWVQHRKMLPGEAIAPLPEEYAR